jgi:flagella basal body P-ring formation protein FlgA
MMRAPSLFICLFLFANAAFADTVTLRPHIEASGRAVTMGDIFDGVPAAIAGRAVAPAPPAGQTASLSMPVLAAAASAAGLEWTAPEGIRDVRVVRPGGMRATLPAQNISTGGGDLGVRRGDTVTIVVQAPGVTLSSRARALEDGAVGQTVRFLNLTSNRTIEASVTGPNAARAELQ